MPALRTYGKRSHTQPEPQPSVVSKRPFKQLSELTPNGPFTQLQSPTTVKRCRLGGAGKPEAEVAIVSQPVISQKDTGTQAGTNCVSSTSCSPKSTKPKTLLDYFSRSSSVSTTAPTSTLDRPQRSLSSPPLPPSEFESDVEPEWDLLPGPEYSNSSYNPHPRHRRRLVLRSSLRHTTRCRRQVESSPPPSTGAVGDDFEVGKSRPLEQLVLSLPPSTQFQFFSSSRQSSRTGSSATSLSSNRSSQCHRCGMPFSRASLEDVRLHRRYCNIISQENRYGSMDFDSGSKIFTNEPLVVDKSTENELTAYIRSLPFNTFKEPIVWSSSAPSSLFSTSSSNEGLVLCVSQSSSSHLRRFGTLVAECAAHEVGTVNDFLGISSSSSATRDRNSAEGTNSGLRTVNDDLWSNRQTEKYKVYIYLRPSGPSSDLPKKSGSRSKSGTKIVVAGCVICEPAVRCSKILVPEDNTSSALVETEPFSPLSPPPACSGPKDDTAATPSFSSSSLCRGSSKGSSVASVGILLMYTHHLYRRQGIGQRLLDCAAGAFEDPTSAAPPRPSLVAFSQMTSSGWGLACSWLKTRSGGNRTPAGSEANNETATSSQQPASLDGRDPADERTLSTERRMFNVNVYDSVFGRAGVDTSAEEVRGLACSDG